MPRTMPVRIDSSKLPSIDPKEFRELLLGWYDRHARRLPWRSPPGVMADPYHVWLSEIMLQQTTVQAVIPYFIKFVEKWPAVEDLANANDAEVMSAWAGLGYYARARNLLKCARFVVEQNRGVFPDTVDKLLLLPGVGDYTSAAIAAIAFGKVSTVIDGNVDRVVTRLHAIQTPLPASKPQIRQEAAFLYQGDNNRPGDFAQAMMDLGATICTPKIPTCGICPVKTFCQGWKMGIAQDLPRKAAKPEKPRRAGLVYWICNESGDVLFETRPVKGLLGGMTGLPTTEWVEWPRKSKIFPEMGHISAIKKGDPVFMDTKLSIRHVFTHFELELKGVSLCVEDSLLLKENQFWVKQDNILDLGLPTVFRKFMKLMHQPSKPAHLRGNDR